MVGQQRRPPQPVVEPDRDVALPTASKCSYHGVVGDDVGRDGHGGEDSGRGGEHAETGVTGEHGVVGEDVLLGHSVEQLAGRIVAAEMEVEGYDLVGDERVGWVGVL